MSPAGISIFLGLVTLGLVTLPYGLIIFALLGYVFYTSR